MPWCSGQHRRGGIDAAAGGEVADLALDRRERHVRPDASPNANLQAGQLGPVVRRDAQAVRDEQSDVGRRDLRVGQGLVDRLAVAVAGGVGLGDAVGVLAGAEADQLGVDLRAAGFGVLVFFEDEQPAAFADGGAVGVGVERADGVGGRVVAASRSAA